MQQQQPIDVTIYPYECINVFLNKCIVPTISGFSFFFFLDQIKFISLVGSKHFERGYSKDGNGGTGIGRTGTELYVAIPTKGKGS